jgi:hypothetical protein
MKIFKQIDLCFIFQPQKPKVQSCFLNHQKLKTMKLKQRSTNLALEEQRKIDEVAEKSPQQQLKVIPQ